MFKKIFIWYEDAKGVTANELPEFLEAMGLIPGMDYIFKFTKDGFSVEVIE